VLIVMVGENVQEMQQANWLPTTDLSLPIPDWMGVWFALFPNAQGLIAQAVAAVIVIGSYVAAGHLRVRLPRRRGETPAYRPERPPTRVTASS
jgi:high-affinity iron transporter